MWGNLTGWTISAALAVAILSFAAWIHQLGEPSDPVAIPRLVNGRPIGSPLSADVTLSAIRLPIDPDTVVRPPGSGDAGPLLEAALDAFRQPATNEAYRQFLSRRRTLDDFDRLPRLPIDKLVEAGEARSIRWLAADPARVINYDTDAREDLRDLQQLAAAAIALANYKLLIPEGQATMRDPDGARRIFQAVFVLGARLAEERVVYDQFNVGLELIAQATSGLLKLGEAGGSLELVGRLRQFDEQRTRYVNEQVLPVWRVISSADAEVIERHAGNLFETARASQERMWRVESILKLGRMRYDASRAANQAYAERVLRELAEDTSDPALAAAVKAARELTVEQFRRIR
jgi:hypothetical protein